MSFNTSTFGLYKDRTEVQGAIENLRRAGFRATDISVLFPDNHGTKDLSIGKSSKAPEGAVAGGICGAAIGGALAGLAAAGMLPVEGLGAFVVAGPLISSFAGIGAGGVAGSVIGALFGTGMSEYVAKRHEGRVRAGGILLSVHCDSSEWVKRARDVMRQTGAEDISCAREAKADFMVTDKPRPLATEYQLRDPHPVIHEKYE